MCGVRCRHNLVARVRRASSAGPLVRRVWRRCAVDLTATARSLRAALREFDPALHHGDDCLALVEELAKTEKACAAARVLAASRVADCGAHRKAGYHDPADWLARSSGSTAGQAERELTTAKRVEGLPDTRAALAGGELSLDQAEEIAKTEKQCPGSEREMLDTARRESLRTLRDKGRDKRLASIKPEDLARRQYDARQHRHWQDELGMVRGTYALEPHIGIPFANRLDAE